MLARGPGHQLSACNQPASQPSITWRPIQLYQEMGQLQVWHFVCSANKCNWCARMQHTLCSAERYWEQLSEKGAGAGVPEWL